MTALLLLSAVLTAQTGNYVRLRADSDEPDPHCLWWRSPELTLHFQQDGTPEISGDAEFAAARRSIATWQTAMNACSTLTLTEGAPVSSRRVEFNHQAPEETQNVLVFRSRGACRDLAECDKSASLFECANRHDCWPHSPLALAVTSSFHDANTGEILDADIEFNDARFHFTATEAEGPRCVPPDFTDCVHYDLENTMTHELGHFLGLDHSNVPGSTMFRDAAEGETEKRSLDADSQQFVCDVYPVGAFPRDCVRHRLEPELGPAGCSSAPGQPLLLALLALWAGRLRRR